MSTIDDFELYLMSQMSASIIVRGALAERGLTEADMRARAHAVVETCELRDGSPHATYHQILKEVLFLEGPTPNLESSSFAPSTSFFYRLPQWRETLLRINRSPRGSAWGIEFVQDPEALKVPSTPLLMDPWKYALDGARSLYSWQEDDSWSDYQRDVYRRSDEPTAPRVLGTFDFGLLQSIREETGAPLPKWHAPSTPTLDLIPRHPGEPLDLRAFKAYEYHDAANRYFVIERIKTGFEVVRVTSLNLADKTLKVNYRATDSSLTNTVAMGLAFHVLLTGFLTDTYRQLATEIRYVDVVTGKQIVTPYAAP